MRSLYEIREEIYCIIDNWFHDRDKQQQFWRLRGRWRERSREKKRV